MSAAASRTRFPGILVDLPPGWRLAADASPLGAGGKIALGGIVLGAMALLGWLVLGTPFVGAAAGAFILLVGALLYRLEGPVVIDAPKGAGRVLLFPERLRGRAPLALLEAQAPRGWRVVSEREAGGAATGRDEVLAELALADGRKVRRYALIGRRGQDEGALAILLADAAGPPLEAAFEALLAGVTIDRARFDRR